MADRTQRPVVGNPARMHRGKLLRSSEEMVRARQVQQWRERIRTAARHRFRARAYNIGLYPVVGGWRLVVNAKTEAAARDINWPKGEDREYRVRFVPSANTYTFEDL